MKMNIRGLLICTIILFLLSYFLDNLSFRANGGFYNFFNTLDEMVYAMQIGKAPNTGEGTLIWVSGNNVIAFLLSSLLYLTLFARKK